MGRYQVTWSPTKMDPTGIREDPGRNVNRLPPSTPTTLPSNRLEYPPTINVTGRAVPEQIFDLAVPAPPSRRSRSGQYQ